MNLYFVQLRAAPTAAVPQAAGMRDADCLIFVMADNPDQALTLAQAYVTHYGWLPAADATIRQPADHVVAQLEPDIQSLAHQDIECITRPSPRRSTRKRAQPCGASQQQRPQTHRRSGRLKQRAAGRAVHADISADQVIGGVHRGLSSAGWFKRPARWEQAAPTGPAAANAEERRRRCSSRSRSPTLGWRADGRTPDGAGRRAWFGTRRPGARHARRR